MAVINVLRLRDLRHRNWWL